MIINDNLLWSMIITLSLFELVWFYAIGLVRYRVETVGSVVLSVLSLSLIELCCWTVDNTTLQYQHPTNAMLRITNEQSCYLLVTTAKIYVHFLENREFQYRMCLEAIYLLFVTFCKWIKSILRVFKISLIKLKDTWAK